MFTYLLGRYEMAVEKPKEAGLYGLLEAMKEDLEAILKELKLLQKALDG